MEHIQRIIPSGLTELLFYLGDIPQSLHQNIDITAHSIVSGQLKQYYDINVSGRLNVFSIVFKPHGLSAFFDMPANELQNQNIPLKFLLRNVANELENKLSDATSFAERITIAEQFLLSRLKQKANHYHFKRMEHSITSINQNRGIVSIDALANQACLSRKQYERVFANYIGTTPKQFLKTVRFQSAIHEKSKHKKLSLTHLTQHCGYYDQPHMINDFNKLAGMKPSAYFKTSDPYSDYFQ